MAENEAHVNFSQTEVRGVFADSDQAAYNRDSR